MKIKIYSETIANENLDKTFDAVAAEIHDEIEAALDAENGKALAFTISTPPTVIEIAASAERYLISNNVAESDRNGAVATYRPGGPSANAYKNSAISTEITLKRAAGVWSLIAVDRVDVYPRNPPKFRVTISDRATRNGVKRWLAAFGRTSLPTDEAIAA